jgi:hypothetical protein
MAVLGRERSPSARFAGDGSAPVAVRVPATTRRHDLELTVVIGAADRFA